MDGDKDDLTLLKAQFCLGYLAGFDQGHNTTVFENRRRRSDSNTEFMFCTTQRRIPVGQMARVVNKWLQEHPQVLHLPMDVLTYAALANAFPCK
jgi:hypothetical protein